MMENLPRFGVFDGVYLVGVFAELAAAIRAAEEYARRQRGLAVYRIRWVDVGSIRPIPQKTGPKLAGNFDRLFESDTAPVISSPYQRNYSGD